MNLRLLAPTLLLLAAPAAFASPITYNFSETVGANTASGTITTDGKLGALATSDIVSYTMTLQNGTYSQTASNVNGYIFGNDFTATGSGLFFNFSDASKGFFVLYGASSGYLCLVDAGITCSGGQNVSNIELGVNNIVTAGATQSGTQQFAFANVATTPEPSSLALFGTGALGMVAAARRRFRRA